MTTLILIRHGETDYNLESRYCGFSNPSLNDKGIRQANKLNRSLKGLKIDRVYSSDLNRALETAKIIFEEKDLPMAKRRNLREINFGRWEGLNFKQILKKYPLIYKKWLNDPFGVDIPAGEKTKHFINRIEKEIKNIAKNNTNKTVAVVSHYGPMRVILNNRFGIKGRDFWKMRLDKAIYVLNISEDIPYGA